MRILVIHQYFLAGGDPGGSRWNQFAKYWAARGHQITVLAGNQDSTTGTTYPDCKGRYVTPQRIGRNITVLRCHVSRRYRSGTKLGRAWGILTFMLSSLIAGVTRAPRPDVIVATSPPLGVALSMWLLCLWYGAASVFEVRDLWPDCFVETGLTSNPLILWPLFKLEWLAYHRSRWVNVLTPAFERRLRERKRVPQSKMSMIPNAADLDIMKPGPKDNAVRKEHGLEGKFVVSYFGAHGWPNMLDQLLDVAGLIKDEMPDVRIMLVGDGIDKDRLVERAARENLSNVVFVDPVPKHRVGDYINASDACTATLRNMPHYNMYYPNKVFDYMCCGRPVIIAIDGVARELVERAGTGIFAEPGNAASFREAILRLRDDPALAERMGRNGPPFVRENFSREKLAEEYLRIVLDVAADKGT